MTNWIDSLLNKTLCVCLSSLLVVQPVLAQVTPDSAAGGNKPSTTSAPNGVPVVNIVAPNGAGISHNKYTDFNVANQGLILNNSRVVGQSQLGGVIIGNPNLASGSEARLILNEVTSTNRSHLLGYQEVFGRSADLILANPNGITCNGCGFINTPRATLTTGRPLFDGLGDLIGLDVDRGDVAIDGLGVNAANVSYFDIISRTASINADIHANNLSVITGRNTVDYASRTATAKADDGSTKPSISIDSSALGGMYAGRISLVGTEQGVGVNFAGDMAASSGDLTISADGKITMRNASAAASVVASSMGGDIEATGQVRAAQEIRLASADRVNIGSTADLGSQAVTLDAATVDNQGTVKSETSLSVQAGSLTNAGELVSDGLAEIAANDVVNTGTVRAAELNAVVANEFDNHATVRADQAMDVAAGTVRNRSGAKIESAGTANLSGALVNAGEVLSTGDLDIQVASLNNSGTLKSAARLNLTGTSNLTVGGLLVGNGGMGLASAGSFDNAGAQLFGFGALSLAISGDFINNGLLSITGDLTGTVNRFTNSGELQVSNDIDVIVQDRLDNTDLLLALGDMSFQVGGTLRNDGGTMVAGGTINLTGIGGARMARLENVSGTIESFDGDILLAADLLENRKRVFSISSQLTMSQEYGMTHRYHPGCNTVPGANISPEGCAYFGPAGLQDGPVDPNEPSYPPIAHVPDPYRSNYVSYYSSVSGGSIIVTEYTDIVSADSAAALISSGRNLTVQGGVITNSHSTVQAVGNIAITGTALNNTGTAVARRLYHASTAPNAFTRCYGGPCRWMEFTNGPILIYNNILASHDAKIVAGGNFTGSFTGQVNNTTIVQQSATLPSGGIPHVDQIGQATPEQQSVPVTAAPPGGVFTPPSPGMFQRAAPTQDYIFETRFQFTDFGTFYGSDYFLNQVGLSTAEVDLLPKRLGDAFFDTRLIREQVVQHTGQRFLNGATSDSAQMQALINAAAAQHTALNLTVGMALTAEQVAALTQSIVWYVEEIFEGQRVLVPKLYLASADQGLLTPQGAFIAANDIAIDAQQIENSGRFAAANDLSLEAQDSIVNNSGQMAAGRNVRLVAVNGDVVNRTATQEITSDIASQTMALTRGGIYAGGNLEVEAGRDIRVEGAEMSAGGNAALSAGRDVEFTTTELNRDVAYGTSGYRYEQRQTTNLGSGLIAGGNVSVEAGGDVRLKGSDIAAVQDIDVQAANDVSITAAQNYSFQHSERSKSSSFHSGTSESVTSVGSSLQGGRNVNVTAGNNLQVAASGIAAGQDATLSAENVTIESMEDYFREERVSRRSGWKGGISGGMVFVGKEKTNHVLKAEGTGQVGSTIMAGRDLTIQATQDATIRASGLGAGRDLTVEAGRDLNFTAANENSSQYELFEQKRTGISFGIKENLSAVADAARTINDGEGSGANKAISAASGALQTVSAAMKAVQQTVAIEVGFGTSKTRTETSQTASVAATSNLSSGRDTTLVAGRDLTMQGTQSQSGADTTLIAGRDAILESAQNTFTSSFDHKSSSSGITASVGYGAFGPSASLTASASRSASDQNYSGTSETHTNVQAGGDVLLLTGNDATLKGATVTGDRVTADVGGDLTIQSVADTGTGSGSSSSAGISLSYSWSQRALDQSQAAGAQNPTGWGTGIGVSGSTGDSSSSKSWISQQSGIIARSDVDVAVGGHTQLDAGVIASTGGDVRLDTGSFGWSDAAGHDQSSSTTIGASVSIPVSGSGQSPDLPFDTIDVAHSETDRRQITRATVAAPQGSSTIVVRDNPAQSLSELNQDLAKAQELTKDSKSSVRVYVDVQAINEIASGFPTIGAGLEELNEGLKQIVKELRALTYALPEDLKYIGESGEKAVETMLRAGVDQSTAEALMRDDSFAREFSGLVSSLDQILSSGFSAELQSIGAASGLGGADGESGTISIEISKGKTHAGEYILNRLNDLQDVIATLPAAEAQAAVIALQTALGGPVKTAISIATNVVFDALAGTAIDTMKQALAESIVASITTLEADQSIAPFLYEQAFSGARLAVELLAGVGSAAIAGGIKASKGIVAEYNPLNPGPLSPNVANTFRSGTYREVITTEPVTLYRVFGGSAGPDGAYWTRTKPEGPVQSIIDSALNPEWGNPATSVIKLDVPPGTRFYEGVAAPQGGLVGGGNQIYLPKVQ